MTGSVEVTLLDYGAGNLSSVEKALVHVGFRVSRARRAAEIVDRGALIIPGVGHYAATGALGGEFRAAVAQHIRRGAPLLGICLGLQYLFEGSDEAPDVPGLGLLAGRCFRLGGDVKVPHVGWNTLETVRDSRLLQGIGRLAVYFTHSYAAPVTGEAVATTTHGLPFASVVERANVFGVQWHPEKSGEAGLSVLRNFLEVARSC